MTRQMVWTCAAAALAALVSIPALPSPAAAQEAARPTPPAVSAWESLPGVVAEGATVVVRTRDGQAAKGRVRSLSDTAIVLESGQLRTIPAMTVESIEGGRAGRRVKNFAARGFKAGAALSALLAVSWLFQPHDGPCTSDDYLTANDALFGMLFCPAAGTAIGAGVGLLVPGGRRVLYARGAPYPVAIAPIAGRGRRGLQLRVAF
jgi:hypothetical protein